MNQSQSLALDMRTPCRALLQEQDNNNCVMLIRRAKDAREREREKGLHLAAYWIRMGTAVEEFSGQ